MDKVAELSRQFTTAGAELAVMLAEQVRAQDPDAYAKVKAGVADGMQLVIAVVTAVKDSPEIRLELVDHEGGRFKLASIAGRMTLNA